MTQSTAGLINRIISLGVDWFNQLLVKEQSTTNNSDNSVINQINRFYINSICSILVTNFGWFGLSKKSSISSISVNSIFN